MTGAQSIVSRSLSVSSVIRIFFPAEKTMVGAPSTACTTVLTATPETAQLKSIPKLTPERIQRATQALALRKRAANNNRCLLYRHRIQFASEEAIAKAGIDIDVVEKRRMVEKIRVNAEIRYDQRLVARLSSRASGTVWRVEKEVGQPVRKGEVLALVDSVAVGKAKAKLLQALARVELKKEMVTTLKPLAGNAVPPVTFLEAKTELREAEIQVVAAKQELANLGLPVGVNDLKDLSPEELSRRMRFLGLPYGLAGRLDKEAVTANLIPVLCPLDGVVVERQVVSGEVVDTSKPLFVVADTRQMWLMLDVAQEDAPYVKPGQTVEFAGDDGGREVTARITWISTEAGRTTRTVKARAELANPEGRLRAETFGTAHVILREEERAFVVPSEAIQWDGSCRVVFVRDRRYFDNDLAKVFHVRTVRPGAQADGYTEIIAGVLPGEVVATKGSGVLRGQLLRGNLGAG